MSTAAETMATGPENASNSADAPTVSARILKKRETDRKCQRMIRERTKSRIAYLEGLVEQFREQDPSGRVETLMKQLTDVRSERDHLEKKVKNIESIISGGKVKDEPDLHDLNMASLTTNGLDETPLSASSHRTARDSQSPPDDIVSNSHDTPTYVIHNRQYNAYLESAAAASLPTSGLHPTFNKNGSCECSAQEAKGGPNEVGNRWLYANEKLTEWFKWSPAVLDMKGYSVYNDDVPVRAIVEGWDAVEQQGNMHPAWQLLRGIDENIFGSLEPRERLGSLQLMGWLLMAHINPTREQHMKLPPFYLKRPSHDMLHSYAIEYFAWPGLRERFVYSEHRYCSTGFWRLFCQNIRIKWQYEFRDCYVRNLDTGLYKISPTFHERISDIRAWTMGLDMFKQYPELYSDIPAWNHIPASINSRSTFGRPARMALPPSSEVSNPSKSRRGSGQQTSRTHPTQQMHIQMPGSTPDLPIHPTPPAPQPGSYSCSPHSSIDTVTTPLSTAFNYSSASVVVSMTDMQHASMLPAWDYTNGLGAFPMHPA